ncbi:MAG TPA: 5'-3' exonuclease H3TH domain-containing protein [Noviherbaspirillum sp.]|nr:5'-3' exonuclease H3TH domain-containing protein [Noviherbaspirillum sp.]
MAKLLAIDILNLVRRLYEANSEPDTAEKMEAVLHGAAAAVRRVLEVHQPTHVLCALDHGGPSWRHAIHPAYRETHASMPDPLRETLPRLHALLAGLGVPVVSVEGAEADDMIATAVRRWLAEGRGEAVIASTDRKLHPLVAEGALVWDAFRNEWHDSAWVERRYGVPPEMLADLLALVGNPAHGIPGIPKIGEKTAAKLLHAYRDLDGIMAGAGILLNPLGQRLRAGRDDAYLSRELLRLKSDVRLGITWNALRFPAAR